MVKLIVKQFLQHWQIWLSVIPIFFVSGLIFGAALILMAAVNRAGADAAVDYGAFLQMPIFIGGIVLCILTTNAMKQCIDLFDDINDILLLLGSSPVQLSFLMTGQMMLIGLIGAAAGSLFSFKVAQLFLAVLPVDSASQTLSELPLHFSERVVVAVMAIQTFLIIFTCMRYCLKSFKQRNGSLSSYNRLGKSKNGGRVIGLMALLTSIGATLLLYVKEVPDPGVMNEYNSSMNNSMSLLLLVWLTLIIGLNFLMRPLFNGLVNKIVDVPSMTRHPRIRSAFYNLQYNVEGLVKLSRPLSIIILLVGNFVALFLNTKLLVDGMNDDTYIYDLIISLVFVFGAPIVISLANIITSICLFKLKTKTESEEYFFSGCTPNWIFNLKLIEIGTVSVISILITLFGTFLFAVPLLRVAYLGGGDIFKANWSFNILLSLGIFSLFFLCFALIYFVERQSIKAYMG
ncbi:hypothetical protein [Enterococcus pallens]|uniref:ABC3 transporter permease protein domain-containing protein n=1 Tax=Enterococcus pallens ATCC BAA-351 TaxID=1158607 RepID=R2T6Y1_9ENTE|nr:hypothetical protein [Enterococcus pallens]EOH95994.1 hypothetical protein UAU_01174 [Enterococcus pallens ATCC BAA-351]EOU21650.1 hypothetical protein I588_02497 [Enterococcus pallens ATCC BAA-351]OJG77727.1 hypothetical protein RV10_GL002258 [Enterococcus pallens]